jgi:tetratricopeptide (TPR) repeat protein
VLERAAREQPGNPWTLRALVWELLVAGYLQEAIGVAERYVDLDPLAPVANSRLFKSLYAVGRTSEALAALEVADQLAPDANRIVGAANLVEKRDDIAIAHIEAFLQQHDYGDSSWVRDLVAGARDPVTGQAYLDRRIPQIVASMPEENAYDTWRRLTTWYLFFGFLDRYFEEILDLDLESSWTDADALVEWGIVFRRLGFTAHSKYLEVAERMGLIELWEQRGPPDFCEKVDSQWVCE